MNIAIASKNPTKVEALTEMMAEYPQFADATIISRDVPSGVSDQPKTLEETITGAMNRAKSAYGDCAYSFGIESGLMHVPQTKTGHMDVCVCAIYDGKECCIGLSSAWEPPAAVAKFMLEDGLDMNDAAYKAGYTTNPKVGSAEGLVGIVSHGRLKRKEYTKEAIRTAMIHIEE